MHFLQIFVVMQELKIVEKQNQAILSLKEYRNTTKE